MTSLSNFFNILKLFKRYPFQYRVTILGMKLTSLNKMIELFITRLPVCEAFLEMTSTTRLTPITRSVWMMAFRARTKIIQSFFGRVPLLSIANKWFVVNQPFNINLLVDCGLFNDRKQKFEHWIS